MRDDDGDVSDVLLEIEAHSFRLNSAADQATRWLADTEAHLLKSKVGIELWYDDRPLHTTDVQESDDHKTNFEEILGYARVDGSWCLAVKRVRVESGITTTEDGEPLGRYTERYVDEPARPLLKGSRAIRIEAMKLMRGFLKRLAHRIVHTADAVSAENKAFAKKSK